MGQAKHYKLKEKKHCMRVFFSLSKRYYNMLI